MAELPIVFDDGASYERMMGVWSRLAGEVFLDWLKPATNLSWVDVGCGNGAFTELLIERVAPAEVHGIDPSAAQIAYAKDRPGAKMAAFQTGDAMDLPFDDNSFDAAVMALVIFFVPEPPKGVAEMLRVVRPGGSISAYAWDFTIGGFPLDPIQAEMRAIGLNPPRAPRFEVAALEPLKQLWIDAGLEQVENRAITVQRTFDDFDDLWTTFLLGPSIGAMIKPLPPADVERIRMGLRQRLPPDAQGRITCSGTASAVKGRKPA